jgi:hypothetical protein
VKTYTITIHHPGLPARRYRGLFATDWDAIQSALDQTAGRPCRISARAAT